MSSVCFLCFCIIKSVAVMSRLVNEWPDDGSCVQYACSEYPLDVLSRYMLSQSAVYKLWAAGRLFLAKYCGKWFSVEVYKEKI